MRRLLSPTATRIPHQWNAVRRSASVSWARVLVPRGAISAARLLMGAPRAHRPFLHGLQRPSTATPMPSLAPLTSTPRHRQARGLTGGPPHAFRAPLQPRARSPPPSTHLRRYFHYFHARIPRNPPHPGSAAHLQPSCIPAPPPPAPCIPLHPVSAPSHTLSRAGYRDVHVPPNASDHTQDLRGGRQARGGRARGGEGRSALGG
ncbi:hypothetical protein B0H11DRAFT_2244478 [Mycena galericulata]|nr:hypothetical protein B0H11DRAFT_2244478 [Mycena galericulata]